MRKILVIRFGSLGDVILTSATVLTLKINFPESHVVFLTKERFGSLVSRFDGVDEVVALPDRAGSIGYYSLLQRLDRENFDAVVDLHGNPRSWLARKVISANRKLVYPKRRVERQLIVRRHNKRFPSTWPHTIDLYNSCVEQLDGTAYCRRPVIRSIGENVADVFGTGGGPIVVIAPGAAHPNKQWEIAKFAEVARRLWTEQGCRIVWAVVGEGDLVSGLKGEFPNGAFTEIVSWPIEKLGGVLAASRLTIANDSGLAHLSSAVGTPVIAVFGPTHPALGFAPRGLFDNVIEVDEFCRPCSLHGRKPCYRDQRYCFTRISADMVVREAGRLLESKVNSSRAVFVDRDGTVIKDKHYLSDPDLIEFVPGSVEALRKASEAGYKVVILSNQSGVARGLLTIDDVEKMNNRLLGLLGAEHVRVDGIYYCPYYKDGTVAEYSVESNLRKPFPGMPELAAREHGIDLRKSIVIGDKLDDFNLGRVLGADAYLVRTGHGADEERELPEGSTARKKVFDTLADVVKHVVG